MKPILIRSLLGGALALGFASHGHAEVAVIANPDLGATAIRADDVQAYFLGKKKSWPDGTKVVLSLNDTDATHGAFLDTYVGKSSSSYTSFWKRIVFTGKGSMPDSFADDAAVVAYVAKTPGAIGYVDAVNVGEGVTRLTIE